MPAPHPQCKVRPGRALTLVPADFGPGIAGVALVDVRWTLWMVGR
jgi:hypothetical protein